MDPNVLQALIGNLSFGFQGTALTKDFQASLKLPDDGECNIVIIGKDGKKHKVKVAVNTSDDNAGSHDQGYHSVFVLGGHVYFGQLQITPDQRFVKLRDAFYLAPGTDGHRELHLLKVGHELHAPVDEMTINMAYVMFWQPLNDDGPLVRAIMESA